MMLDMLDRRSLITGLVSFIAAPAIVRVSSLMPVKMIDLGVANNLTSEEIKEMEQIAAAQKMEGRAVQEFHIRLFVKPSVGTKGELWQVTDWTPVTGS